jgi:hypothetical protein
MIGRREFQMVDHKARQSIGLLQDRRERVGKLRKLLETRLAAADDSEVKHVRKLYASLSGLHDRILDCIFDLRQGATNKREAALFNAKAMVLAQESDSLGALVSRHATDVEEPRTIQSRPNQHREEQRGNANPPPSPSNPTRITTGRHLKRLGPSQLEGVSSSEEAAARFFTCTADTHGGKIKHGKKSAGYVTRGGKRIRTKQR